MCRLLLILSCCLTSPLLGQEAAKRSTLTSESMQMVVEAEHYRFHFFKDVVYKETEMQIFSDWAEVLAAKQADESGLSKRGQIEQFKAKGRVRIEESERISVADRAQHDPIAKTTLLEGNVKIDEKRGSTEGAKVTIDHVNNLVKVHGGEQAQSSDVKRPSASIPWAQEEDSKS